MLTKKLALEITEELWTWLAEEDGRKKEDWPGWEKYGEMRLDCPLCEYALPRGECLENCPYHLKFGPCVTPTGGKTLFDKWCKDPLKVHAQVFLEQIRSLRCL